MAKEKSKTKVKPAKAVSQGAEGEKVSRATNIPSRGRTFEGFVVGKFPKRIAIEFERTVFIRKFERFMKKTTRIHARLPDDMENQIQIGNLVRVRECRPLSKIIHFIVVDKLVGGEKK